MKKIILLFLASMSSSMILGQSGGGNFQGLFENSSIMFGMNQSFYGKDWKDFEESFEDDVENLFNNNFRKLNFTLMNEFEHDLIGGIKYLFYGYDFEISGDRSIVKNYNLELNFFKLFLSYPMGSGLYFGLEGGYFVEGKSKYRSRSTSISGIEYETNNKTTIDRSDWEDDGELNSYDYGFLAQYFYTIKDNFLFTTELYYSLSEFSNENSMLTLLIPNSFNYFNLGLTYKFKK
jgi:hypothetical protein